MTIRLVAVSDLHEHLPDIDPCDLLVIGGDLFWTHNNIFNQKHWLETKFFDWCDNVPADSIVYIAGNHDWLFFEGKHLCIYGQPWHVKYLEDNITEFEGLSIYGTPWQPVFMNWAFNAIEERLMHIFSRIPYNLDILISHGPPYGLGDYLPGNREHVGSTSLLNAIDTTNPRLVITGHIHEGYGLYKWGNTVIANCSIMDGSYKPVNKPMVFNISKDNLECLSHELLECCIQSGGGH